MFGKCIINLNFVTEIFQQMPTVITFCLPMMANDEKFYPLPPAVFKPKFGLYSVLLLVLFGLFMAQN